MNNIAILCIMAILWTFSSDKTQIFEWRGKDRSGIYNESNLMKKWPPEGPKEILTVENIGNGFVSPVFTEDHFL